MESTTYLKDVKATPKKLRMYLNEIKKMSPQEALDYLMYSTNKQSRIYYKALHSAIANATNTLKVSPDVLQFKLFLVEEGRKLRRYRAGARGTARPFLKKFSHIKITLVEKPKKVSSMGKKSDKEVKKSEKKIEPKQSKKIESKETKLPKKTVVKSQSSVSGNKETGTKSK